MSPPRVPLGGIHRKALNSLGSQPLMMGIHFNFNRFGHAEPFAMLYASAEMSEFIATHRYSLVSAANHEHHSYNGTWASLGL